MSLELTDPESEARARRVSAMTGEPIAEVLRAALRERHDRLTRERPRWDQEAIDAIVARVSSLPVLDDRSADEILGYDANGLPT